MTLNLSTLYGSVGPSNTNIADAVAADSNMAATIAANVPSASTIATAVAGAVTSGFSNTYTLLTSANYSGTTTQTVSFTPTGYKQILVVYEPFNMTNVAGNTMLVTFNSDSSTTNYTAIGRQYSNGAPYVSTYAQYGNAGLYFTGTNAGANMQAWFRISNPNSTSSKIIEGATTGYSNGGTEFAIGRYLGTSAISSITLTCTASTNISASQSGSQIRVFGVN
jgi:hypothetical protein